MHSKPCEKAENEKKTEKVVSKNRLKRLAVQRSEKKAGKAKRQPECEACCVGEACGWEFILSCKTCSGI